MVAQLEIRHLRTLHQSQRIQLGFLMAPEPVGADELHYLNLFAFVLDADRARHARRGGGYMALGHALELRANDGVGNIGRCIALNGGKLVKVTPPLFWDGVGIVKVLIVQIFNVGCIAPRYMGTTPEMLQIGRASCRERAWIMAGDGY